MGALLWALSLQSPAGWNIEVRWEISCKHRSLGSPLGVWNWVYLPHRCIISTSLSCGPRGRTSSFTENSPWTSCYRIRGLLEGPPPACLIKIGSWVGNKSSLDVEKGMLEGKGAVDRKPIFLGHIFPLDGTLNLLTHSKPLTVFYSLAVQ